MESNYLNFIQRKTLSAVFVTIKITQNRSIIGALITLMVLFLLIEISNGHLNLYFRKLKNIVVRIIITIATNKTPDTGRFTKS